MAITYATWDPAKKNTNLALSWWNLISDATTIVDNHQAVLSTIWVSSWKWYWEITMTNLWASDQVLPWIWKSTMGLWSNQFVGVDANWWSYHSQSGNKYNNSSGVAYGATFTVWDIIGVALDMTAWTLIFYKNNTSQWTAYTWLSGTFYAAQSLFDHTNVRTTANFGATTMAYTAPSGYNQWLYTSTSTTNSNFFAFL